MFNKSHTLRRIVDSQNLEFILGEQWILIHCPQTNELIVGHIHKVFPIPKGQAIWWFCPACQGWHVVIASSAPIGQQPLNDNPQTEQCDNHSAD